VTTSGRKEGGWMEEKEMEGGGWRTRMKRAVNPPVAFGST